MVKRMTKEQRADALLECARDWQNIQPANVKCGWNSVWLLLSDMIWDADVAIDAASAALSEVCHGMGFDIE